MDLPPDFDGKMDLHCPSGFSDGKMDLPPDFEREDGFTSGFRYNEILTGRWIYIVPPRVRREDGFTSGFRREDGFTSMIRHYGF